MKEADLSKRIIRELRAYGAWAVKTHGDPRQSRGLPDIIACYEGLFVGFEVKLPGKERTVTPLQAHTLEQITLAGGVAHVVTSPSEALAILKELV